MKPQWVASVAAVTVSGLFLAAVWAAPGDTLFVKSRGTELKGDAKASAATLATLNQGDKVKQLAVKGPWYEVDAGGKKGYVYRGRLGDTAPTQESLAGVAGTGSMKEDVNTGSWVRGVDKVAADYGKRNKISDKEIAYVNYQHSIIFPDLLPEDVRKKVELGLADSKDRTALKDADLNKFLSDGKLGEFAD